MSNRNAFDRLFDGRQVPSKDEDDYDRKQREEPVEEPAPKRGRVSSPLGPIKQMTAEEIVHQNRGKP